MGQIFELIPKVMAEVGVIEKNKKNAQQGFKFRGIDDVCAAVQPAMIKHQIFYAPEVLDSRTVDRESKSGNPLIYTYLKVAYTFYAPDGSSFRVVTVGEAMDSADKSSNKAMSAALKYALLQLFCVPTEALDDADADSLEPRGRISPDEGRQQRGAQQSPSRPQAVPPPQASNEPKIDGETVKAICRLWPDHGLKKNGSTFAVPLGEYLKEKKGIENIGDLTAESGKKLLEWLQQKALATQQVGESQPEQPKAEPGAGLDQWRCTRESDGNRSLAMGVLKATEYIERFVSPEVWRKELEAFFPEYEPPVSRKTLSAEECQKWVEYLNDWATTKQKQNAA